MAEALVWAREQILLEEFSHSLHRPSDVFKAVLKALHCCLLGDPCRVNDLVGSFTTSMKIIARTFEGPISEYYIDLVVESLGGIAKFRQDDVELTKVDLEKIENVTLKMGAGASGNSAVDIVYPAGKNMEEVVRKVKSALGEQGIPMGRLRRRPEPRKDSTLTTISLETVQQIHLSGNIEFSACSSELDLYTDECTPESSTCKILRQVSRLLEDHPFHSICCEGHTDNKPHPFGSNLELSQERAAAVKSHLVGLGLLEDRIRAVGYGGRPCVSNETLENRRLNRKVCFLLCESETRYSLHSLGRRGGLMENKDAVRKLKFVAVDVTQQLGIRRAAAEVLVQSYWKWGKVKALHLVGREKFLDEDSVQHMIVTCIILDCL